jgi:RNA polymerase sigma-70 factor (ECF subfamily)
MGGPDGGFHTTPWTQILGLRVLDEAGRRGVKGRVISQYWKPVYCYLRRRGNDNEEAKDLTEGFFADVVLGRTLLEKADPEQGRFRTYLLTALRNYVTSVLRSASSEKRRPTGGLVSLDAFETTVVAIADGAPEDEFNRAWALSIVASALHDVETQCAKSGKTSHWEVFRARVLDPILEGKTAPSLDQWCEGRPGVTPSQASNMLVNAKRMFRTSLKRCVRPLVGTDDEVDGEIAELMSLLGPARAGSA